MIPTVFKVGTHVIYWHYYKHPALYGYQRCEDLGRIVEVTYTSGYVLWCHLDKTRRWVTTDTVIREASPIEVFAYEANR